jgi:hypothetical protein
MNIEQEYQEFENLIDQVLYDQDIGCNWSGCFEPKQGLYLCSHHLKLILHEKIEKRPSLNQCAVMRCKKLKTIDSHLCFDHHTSMDQFNITKQMQCHYHTCNQVKSISSKRYCSSHYLKYEA